MKNKSEFLQNELWKMSIAGAFQRADIYKNNIFENERELFRKNLYGFVNNLIENYSGKINDETHFNNIENICDHSNNYFKKILNNGRLNIGISQKLLNLYLKYLWCSNLLKTIPPHCPIDSNIIKLTSKKGIKWTAIPSKEIYFSIINELKEKANDYTLAEWELIQFNNITSLKLKNYDGEK